MYSNLLAGQRKSMFSETDTQGAVWGNPLHHITAAAWAASADADGGPQRTYLVGMGTAGTLLADYYGTAAPYPPVHHLHDSALPAPGGNPLPTATTPDELAYATAQGTPARLCQAAVGLVQGMAAGERVVIVCAAANADLAAVVARPARQRQVYVHMVVVDPGMPPGGGTYVAAQRAVGSTQYVYTAHGPNAAGYHTPWAAPGVRYQGVYTHHYNKPSHMGGRKVWRLQTHELAALPHGTPLVERGGNTVVWEPGMDYNPIAELRGSGSYTMYSIDEATYSTVYGRGAAW